jgi:hypothetical protein
LRAAERNNESAKKAEFKNESSKHVNVQNLVTPVKNTLPNASSTNHTHNVNNNSISNNNINNNNNNNNNKIKSISGPTSSSSLIDSGEERIFKCEHEGCTSSFRTRSSLKDHQKVHSDER